MKKVTEVFAAIFGVLTIVFYISSIQEVKTGYGSMQVANIQATVFAAACAIMCVTNIVGCFILDSIEACQWSIDKAIKEGLLTNATNTKPENGTSAASVPSVSNSRSTFLSERKTEAGAQWRCQKCGTWNSNSAQYCKDCGQYK